MIDASEPVMSSCPIQISLVDPAENGKWVVEHLKYYGEYEPELTCKNIGTPLILNPEELSWRNSYRDKSNPQYHLYVIKVSFYADDKSVDSIQLKWNLLPSKPAISVVDFIYTYNFEDDSIWPNGYLILTAQSDNVEEYCLWASETFLFEPPSMFHCGFPYDANEEGCTYFEYDADWGEYIAIEAINKFGTIYSETICSTDYIKDPEVLKRLEEIKNGLSVEEISTTQSQPYSRIKDNTIVFETTVDNPRIVDISGKLICSVQSGADIDISDFPSGFYILTYSINSKPYQSKFLKP